MIAAAVGFIAVFSYLAALFNYSDVLDGRAADVLPRLLALGESGRVVWVIYAFLPILLVPAGIAAHAAFNSAAPNASRLSLVASIVAAVSMLLGLARWPSVYWELARAYGHSTADARQAIDAVFLGLNVYLGNYIGEFLGEAALSTLFIGVGYSAPRSTLVRRWFGYAGMALGVIGWITAFRNVTAAVNWVAEVNNYLLPLWLIVLGLVLVRWRPT